jgi:hypothetical protein
VREGSVAVDSEVDLEGPLLLVDEWGWGEGGVVLSSERVVAVAVAVLIGSTGVERCEVGRVRFCWLDCQAEYEETTVVASSSGCVRGMGKRRKTSVLGGL